jgi:hypothetical protein
MAEVIEHGRHAQALNQPGEVDDRGDVGEKLQMPAEFADTLREGACRVDREVPAPNSRFSLTPRAPRR